MKGNLAMRLFFIRHGQTIGDVEDRYGGEYDDALSALGKQQALQLANELASSGIEKIFTSPLLRAKQTAQELADRVKCPIVILPTLKERNQYGVLTGLTKAESCQRYPNLVELAKDRLNTLPDAESYADSSKRMTSAYKETLSQTTTCAAVVWHGGGMRVLFRDILKLGELREIGDCCWVELEKSQPDRPFTIKQTTRLTFDF